MGSRARWPLRSVSISEKIFFSSEGRPHESRRDPPRYYDEQDRSDREKEEPHEERRRCVGAPWCKERRHDRLTSQYVTQNLVNGDYGSDACKFFHGDLGCAVCMANKMASPGGRPEAKVRPDGGRR